MMIKRKKLSFYTKEYFSFSKSQKNGILALIALIFLILMLKIILPRIQKTHPAINISSFEKEIEAFEKKTDTMQRTPNYPMHKGAPYHKTTPLPEHKKNLIHIEINSTDTSTLEQLPGIGKILARRIIKYRDLLGGYYQHKQLSEVYGLKSDVIQKIIPYLLIDTLKIKKIAINTAGFKEINSHPYISFEQTKTLVNARKQSSLGTIDQLLRSQIFTEEELDKLRPYLNIGKE